MTDFGLYVHIPFCESKCYYCNFVSKCCDKNMQEKYFQTLWKDIARKKNNKVVTSVYFGGGTPSVVDEKLINKTLETIRENFALSKNCEISIECNPNSIDEKKLGEYKNAGINRISFGVQSFDDKILKKLNRKHTAKQAFSAIKFARIAGFENINIDFLLGIRNNLKNFEQNIKKCIDLGITHISAYMLILEENTPLFKQQTSDFISTDDESVEEYESLLKILQKYDFERYEVSNFAVKGFSCKHNINYWQCGEYLGFGVSAHSFVDGKRIENINTIENYHEKIQEKVEILTEKEKIEEKIMLGLRLSGGVDIDEIKKMGYDIQKIKRKELKIFESKKIIAIKNKKLYVKPAYFGVLNEIILTFLD